jgi:hypothetical protein
MAQSYRESTADGPNLPFCIERDAACCRAALWSSHSILRHFGEPQHSRIDGEQELATRGDANPRLVEALQMVGVKLRPLTFRAAWRHVLEAAHRTRRR